MHKILGVFLLAIFIVSALPCVSAGFADNGQTSVSVVKVEQRAQRKPDLTLTSDDIVFSQVSPTEGEKVIITATIRNLGNTWAWSVEVGFYDGNALVGIKTAGTIKAGGTGKASVEWTATPAGENLIRVVADPKNKISESNEANNDASKAITVSGVGVLIPDLTLTPADIAFTPATPVEGQSVTIKATIHNVGNGSASNVKVSFYDGSPATETLIDSDTVVSMAAEGTGTASAVWTATGVRTHEIYVVVDPDNSIGETKENNNEASRTIEVAEAPLTPPYDYELFIEIAYIGNHEPTQSVREYIHSCYYERGINVAFYVEDVTSAVISLGINYANGINDNEFWAIEKEVNGLGDDHAGGDPNKGVYFSKWKWVLFGTVVEGQPNVVGYTYVMVQRVGWSKYDLLAGNYIFIADETADNWAGGKVEEYGAEAVVLMHEMGHSVGIGILDRRGREVYCSDLECVMAMLSVSNADNYGSWSYCIDHWATRNMEYYAV